MSQPVASPASPAPGTIILKPAYSLGEGYNEYRAAVACKPGMLLEVTSTVDANGHHTVKPQTFTGSQLYTDRRLVSLEKPYAADVPGASSVDTGGIDDTFAIGAMVPTRSCQSGDMMYMRLAPNVTTTVGSMLTSNGDGRLRLATGANIRVCRALEAITGGGSEAWVRVEMV